MRVRSVVALVVLVGLLAAGDVLARRWAEGRLAERAAAFYPPARRADARIEGFPFVGRLLTSGTVPRITVTLTDLGPDIVEFDSLTLDLRDTELDRDELFGGNVKVTDVAQGRLEAVIDGPSLAQAIGLDLRFGDGTVEVHRQFQGADIVVMARIEVEGSTLTLVPTDVQGADVPLDALAVTYEIPAAALFTGVATVRAVPGAVVVSYRVDDVPPALVGGGG